MIPDADSHLPAVLIGALAVPAVVEVGEIPLKHAVGQIVRAVGGLDDVVIHAGLRHRDGSAVLEVHQPDICGIDVVEPVAVLPIVVDGFIPQERETRVACGVVIPCAEEDAVAVVVAVAEIDAHEVGQLILAGVAVHNDGDIVAAVIGCGVQGFCELLIVGDVDGDLPDHKVQRIAVHIAREPAALAAYHSILVRRCVIDRAGVPRDGHGVRLSVLVDEMDACLLGESRTHTALSDEEVRVESALCQGLPASVIEGGVLGSHIVHNYLVAIRIDVRLQPVRLEELEEPFAGIGRRGVHQVARIDG